MLLIKTSNRRRKYKILIQHKLRFNNLTKLNLNKKKSLENKIKKEDIAIITMVIPGKENGEKKINATDNLDKKIWKANKLLENKYKERDIMAKDIIMAKEIMMVKEIIMAKDINMV